MHKPGTDLKPVQSKASTDTVQMNIEYEIPCKPHDALDRSENVDKPIHKYLEYNFPKTQVVSAGVSDASQMAFMVSQFNHFRRFPYTLGERRTRRNDLWYRFLSYAEAGQTMPDLEFVEMVLYTTGRIKDCRSLAVKLLKRFHTLAGVFNAELYQLQDLGPIDQDIVNAFRAVRGVAAHLARQEIISQPVIKNWEKLIVYLRASIAHRTVEHLRVLFLDRQNALLADEMQNDGTIDHTPCYPREIVKRALILDAGAIILVHNHPSNRPNPSQGDIDMTNQIKISLESVSIVLHDHVILTRESETSFKQLGLL